jgi:hypothetical protein
MIRRSIVSSTHTAARNDADDGPTEDPMALHSPKLRLACGASASRSPLRAAPDAHRLHTETKGP